MSTTATTITYDQVHKPNKKRYLVMDGDVVEYIIKAKTNKRGTRVYKLYHSESDIWREKTKGTFAFAMYDNGWTIRFKSPEEGFDIKKIEYSDAMYIRLLTTLHASLEQNDPLPRVVEDTGDVIVCE